jgi:hypothetical protein
LAGREWQVVQVAEEPGCLNVHDTPGAVWQVAHSPANSCFVAGGVWHDAQSGFSVGCVNANSAAGWWHVSHGAVLVAGPVLA